MKTSIRLLNGDLVTIDVPGAATMPPASAVSVVETDGVELELTSGTPAILDFFTSSTGSVLGHEVTLRGGETLRIGALGGDPQHGRAFALSVGEDAIFGSCAPGLAVEELAAWLGRMTFRSTAQGPTVTPGRGQAWAAARAHAVAQQVILGGSRGYLLDVRRAEGAAMAPQRSQGVPVRGGRLMRSPAADEHRHVILDTSDFVAYGLPFDSTSLDEVATSMSRVTTERS